MNTKHWTLKWNQLRLSHLYVWFFLRYFFLFIGSFVEQQITKWHTIWNGNTKVVTLRQTNRARMVHEATLRWYCVRHSTSACIQIHNNSLVVSKCTTCCWNCFVHHFFFFTIRNDRQNDNLSSFGFDVSINGFFVTLKSP